MADILTPDEKPSPASTPPSAGSVSPPKIQLPMTPLSYSWNPTPNIHAIYAQQALLAQQHAARGMIPSHNHHQEIVDSRPKRVRTIFTQSQIDRLEVEFTKSQYMVGSDRVELAKDLDLSETQVKVWFQNRRIKSRKQKKIQNESTEERSESSDTESDTTANS